MSQPGRPPTSRTGLLKRFIFFGYDLARQSVMMGPARLTGRNRGEAPPLLENGGKTTLKRGGRRKRATYKARPFMGPAFEANKRQLPQMWVNRAILGASGARRGSEQWELTFRFSALPNQSNISIGNITGITKFGWDYLWVQYEDDVDEEAVKLIKKPTAVYVEQVFPAALFSINLGIGA